MKKIPNAEFNQKLRSLAKPLTVLGISSIGGFAKGRTWFTRAPGGGGALMSYSSTLAEAAADTERNTVETTWTKVKQITITDILATPQPFSLATYFELKSENGSYIAYGRVYRNGGAVGTQQSTYSTSYVAFEEAIAGWSQGDLYQLYIKASAGSPDWWRAYARNFRVMGSWGKTVGNIWTVDTN